MGKNKKLKLEKLNIVNKVILQYYGIGELENKLRMFAKYLGDKHSGKESVVSNFESVMAFWNYFDYWYYEPLEQEMQDINFCKPENDGTASEFSTGYISPDVQNLYQSIFRLDISVWPITFHLWVYVLFLLKAGHLEELGILHQI